MIHNIVVVDGQEYKAVKQVGSESCVGCSFFNGNCETPGVPCMAMERDDATQVKYKPHYKLKHK